MFFGGGNPFEGMGGMPGMGRQRGPIDNKGLYETLKVGQKASASEIKKAFHKLARDHHPDRGGDKEKFQEIQQAYEVLSDPQKRDIYDEGGLEAVKGEGGRGGGMDDIFSMFGGGGRAQQQRRGPQKGKPVQYPLKVTLEEIYAGKKTKIAVNRERICTVCNGIGGKEGAVQKCPDCKGRGMVTKMV